MKLEMENISTTEYEMFLGARACFHGQKDPFMGQAFQDGWRKMDLRLATRNRNPSSVEAKLWQQAANTAWQHALSMPWGSATYFAFRFAQLADFKVAQLASHIENDNSMLDLMADISKLGIKL